MQTTYRINYGFVLIVGRIQITSIMYNSHLKLKMQKKLIQQKILDNVIIAQKIKEQNQELAHFFFLQILMKKRKKNEELENKNNILLSPIDLDLISNNSSNLLLK